MDLLQFEKRKKDHLSQAMDCANQAVGFSGLDRILLLHDALPEMDFPEVSLQSSFLGKPLPTPFFISGMTAGHPDAMEINTALAERCQARGWALGIGSQRRDLEPGGSSASIEKWSAFRERFPRLILFANLGAAQLREFPPERIAHFLESFHPDALVIHCNALQEALQPEGTPNFKNVTQRLGTLCEALTYPVVLKETGCGFSKKTLEKIKNIGLAAVDLSGLGGTHWGRIEGRRTPRNSVRAQAAASFANWGISTVQSLLNAREVLSTDSDQAGRMEIWASGGVRSGLDAAKLIALGAANVGYARPALQALAGGGDELDRWMEQQEFELRLALFCTGSDSLGYLRGNKQAWTINGI